MKIFRFLREPLIFRDSKEGFIHSANMGSNSQDEFYADEIEQISENGVIDTNNHIMLAKYKSNVRLLMNRVLQEGRLQEFRIIREDDLFPYDWMWRVSSSKTYGEYSKSSIAYQTRMAKARENLKAKKGEKVRSLPFEVPITKEELQEELDKLDSNYGFVFEPVKFRSTKHFTVNTPLPYTGSYNQVSSHRNFIVVDRINNFCKSGYGYSADFQDAYLDITHEELPISDDAIILIDADRYEDIIKDEEVREQLSGRKVILYRGDEAVAINMVLSEEGVLPYKPGRFIEYSQRLYDIMDMSMEELCINNGLDYAQGHGNLFGKGGHFSDLYDGENEERVFFQDQLLSFLCDLFPEDSKVIREYLFLKPEEVISRIGVDKFNEAIVEFNMIQKEQTTKSRKFYDMDHQNIDDETRKIFISTIRAIRDYYKKSIVSVSSMMEDNLHEAIKLFFHSNTILEQLNAAKEVQKYLYEIYQSSSLFGK